MRLLIDSSAWYAYFTGEAARIADKVYKLIRSGEGCTAGVVIAEVLDAVEDRSKVTHVMRAMQSLHYLNDTLEVWRNTANLAHRTKQNGLNLPLSVLHIASLSQFYRIPIFSAGDRFRKVPGVKLKEP